MHFATRLTQCRLARAITLVCVTAPLGGLVTVVRAQDIDLGNLGDHGIRIDGIDQHDYSGFSVSGAGDVNGDGLADLIVGAPGTEVDGDGAAGESYVVFGRSSGTSVDLATLGTGGFRISGFNVSDRSGFTVSGAGDVNGDGLADLVVGTSRSNPFGDGGPGQGYVVFGKANNAPVDLAALGSGGFGIDGIDAGDSLGWSISGAGDVNGDGLADLIVGARNADPGGDASAGESYVVFGKASSTRVNLAALDAGGFRIDGIDAHDYSGCSVSGAGDVNGDGLADVIVGAIGADRGRDFSVGESYVVFGKAGSSPVDLAALGAGGFRISGIGHHDLAGRSVSGAGDVNGDGLGDVIVGAPGAHAAGGGPGSESYVVFGKASVTPVDLEAIGSGGFRIDGSGDYVYSGISVSGAGDINGDGLADLIVGSPNADPGGNASAGESYVVFGKASNTPVDLGALGASGFRMDGIDVGDLSGFSVSGAGDVNGDGLADVIVGAYAARPDGDSTAGESYVVFSGALPPISASVQARSADGDPPRTAFGISGDGSNHSTPDARAWVDFADGDDPLAISSTETVTLTRSAVAFSAPAAAVSWHLQTTRQNWTSAELRLRYLTSELLIDDENTMQIVYSSSGTAPFTRLESVVNSLDNTISANITQPGFLFLGQQVVPPLFADGFE